MESITTFHAKILSIIPLRSGKTNSALEARFVIGRLPKTGHTGCSIFILLAIGGEELNLSSLELGKRGEKRAKVRHESKYEDSGQT